MERCPQCRARLKGRTICPRCETDLSLLHAIESAADICSRLAVKRLAAGDIEAAATQAAAARDLHATEFHRAVAGFVQSVRKSWRFTPPS
jgi:Zn-finger nucleic acid-binding protein